MHPVYLKTFAISQVVERVQQTPYAVEGLFSLLGKSCNQLVEKNAFSPRLACHPRSTRFAFFRANDDWPSKNIGLSIYVLRIYT